MEPNPSETMPEKRAKSKKKRGRKPEVLKIEGDWKDAMKRALERGKPPKAPDAKDDKSNNGPDA